MFELHVLAAEELDLGLGGEQSGGLALDGDELAGGVIEADEGLREVDEFLGDAVIFAALLPVFAFDFVELVHAVLLEVLVLEDGDFLFFANFMEVIHVELAHERRELAVLEVFGQDLPRELLLVLHDEAVALVRPLHDAAVPFVLNLGPHTSRIL